MKNREKKRERERGVCIRRELERGNNNNKKKAHLNKS